MKCVAVLALVLASAVAFVPATTPVGLKKVALAQHKGAGGMNDTRDPEPSEHEDARKSIKAAPSFEEYMKQKQAEEANK